MRRRRRRRSYRRRAESAARRSDVYQDRRPDLLAIGASRVFPLPRARRNPYSPKRTTIKFDRAASGNRRLAAPVYTSVKQQRPEAKLSPCASKARALYFAGLEAKKHGGKSSRPPSQRYEECKRNG